MRQLIQTEVKLHLSKMIVLIWARHIILVHIFMNFLIHSVFEGGKVVESDAHITGMMWGVQMSRHLSKNLVRKLVKSLYSILLINHANRTMKYKAQIRSTTM